MENGLRDAANQTLGKSIIFARNHRHAVLLRELFDEMYPQYGGRFCQVIDNYDPRAEQLIDDFKGQGRNDELTIAISVDMLDTGIDVPEIVNLDFAKPIRSPIKFWQMIGRGTRLCKNLFGPGKDKSIFRIFDHWGNFERFGMDDFRPAEPSRQPSLMEEVFHARLNLAETARRKGNDFGLNLAINLIHSDINSLPTKSIQIKDQWRVIQSVSDIETLKDFAPNTLITLQQEIGPLMQWRDIRGAQDAYQLDRLIARLQNAVLNESNEVEDLKIILLDWIASLPMHLNPVREKDAVITQVRSDEFWEGITIEDLESVRDPLRQIMHHRLRQEPPEPQQRVIDVTETEQQIITNRRTTNLRTIDEHAFQQVVEEELKKHFDHPVMEKIRKAERINTDDIETLASLILVQSPNASKDVLQEFFDTTVEELIFGIRQAVGMDHEAIEKHFAQFVNRHPSLNAKQTRFLGRLKNHIARYGSITIDKLYDQPFTKIDSDGPDGIFQNPRDLDELIDELRIFQPPLRII